MSEKVITREVLVHLTRSAGGEAFVVSESKELARICSTISDRMHNQYTFGYYPSRRQDQEWRSIRVEAKIPGLRVVASKAGYYPAVAADDRRQVESEEILGWKQALGGTVCVRARSPVYQLNDSLSFDRELLEVDIQGSVAYARALERAGVFSAKERLRVQTALRNLLDEHRRNPRLIERSRAEDVHTYVEQALAAKVGDLGLKLHTGRSPQRPGCYRPEAVSRSPRSALWRPSSTGS